MTDDFYIGWADRTPPAIHRRVRVIVGLLLALVVALGMGLAFSQRTIGVSVFEWGKIKSFSGILRARPYPHLLAPRPGPDSGETVFSSYYLVKPFKFGFDSEAARRFDGQAVRLKGTLIYRGRQAMIEVVPDSLQPLERPGPYLTAAPTNSPVSLGEHTLRGEIVDSKCYLGVMNPGNLIPHRACAIRCISGGIPPLLLVRQGNGTALYFLLVAPDGRPVNQQVLHLVAEPVEITGEVERQGDLLVLRADPATFRRAGR